jgi:hypothetical protein
MSKMGFCAFHDEGVGAPLNFVAPKKNYTKEQFHTECIEYADGFHTLSEVKEGYCRYNPPAGDLTSDRPNGYYTFSEEGRGSFPVWYVDVLPTLDPKVTSFS